MKQKSNKLESLRRDLYWLARQETDPELKAEYWRMWGVAKSAESEYDEIIRDILMQGVRNPAFPDDMIGWLDDDFESPLERYENRWKKKAMMIKTIRMKIKSNPIDSFK